MLRAVAKPSFAGVAVVEGYTEAFNSRDVEAAVEIFHPEAEIVPPQAPYYSPPGTTYHGRAGARSLLRAVFARAPHLRLETREFRTLRDGLLVSFSLLENPARNGDTRDAAVVLRIVGAQILRCDAYVTEADAYDATRRQAQAGLRLSERHGRSSARGAENPRLTPRQGEVFHLLALGLTTYEIADRLFISPDTVRTHVRNGVVNLEAKTRVQATALALARGEIELWR
jgi:DNA-binding CsgD family transcriptional regulator